MNTSSRLSDTNLKLNRPIYIGLSVLDLMYDSCTTSITTTSNRNIHLHSSSSPIPTASPTPSPPQTSMTICTAINNTSSIFYNVENEKSYREDERRVEWYTDA